MYAVVKSGGKQHKVEVGETVSVELLDAEAGAVVTLPALLVADGDKVLTGADAANATVTAEVLGHGKADKVLVFKFRKRKGSKKLKGHRQGLTLIKVTDIALVGAKKAAKKAEAPVAVVVEEKPAKKPVAKKAEAAVAEKPAAKKAPAKKADAAAEKPAAKKAPAKKADAAVAEKKPAAKKPAAKKTDGETAAKKPAAKKPAVKKTTKPAEPAE
ncbi:MAG: 50S ribosomal protein L21 [Coriobacteriia bacterium]|nr:50S ribosomal protein L21 [Coriobacteriia bacterium]